MRVPSIGVRAVLEAFPNRLGFVGKGDWLRADVGETPGITSGSHGACPLFRQSLPRFAVPRSPGAVRRGLRAIAAEGHAAPSPGVGLRPVEKEQDAALALAGADQAKVLVADEVGDRLRERLEALLGRCPSPDPSQAKRAFVGARCGHRVAAIPDLPVRVASCEQVIQRTQLGGGFRPEFPACMPCDETPQPFTQHPGPLGDLVEHLAAPASSRKRNTSALSIAPVSSSHSRSSLPSRSQSVQTPRGVDRLLMKSRARWSPVKMAGGRGLASGGKLSTARST